MAKILVAEDNRDVVLMLQTCLELEGHKVTAAADGLEAITLAMKEPPDLMILDIMMPHINGFEVCKLLRTNAQLKQVPIMMLTALNQIEDKTAAFDAGADDYLVKPFNVQEIRLRVRALLRRSYQTLDPQDNGMLIVGEVCLDTRNYEALVNGERIRLTPLEFQILHHLMKRPDQAVTLDELLQEIFDYPPSTGSPLGLRTHVKNLRAKIEKNPAEPEYIETLSRIGYRFNSHVKRAAVEV